MKELEEESFDIVYDKGTMDALMCGNGDVWELFKRNCRYL